MAIYKFDRITVTPTPPPDPVAADFTAGDIGSVCGAAENTYYTNGAFDVGKIVYTDNTLSIPVTGFSYIRLAVTGQVYTIDPGTGQVLTNTGNSC